MQKTQVPLLPPLPPVPLADKAKKTPIPIIRNVLPQIIGQRQYALTIEENEGN